MKYNFYITPTFEKSAKPLLKKYLSLKDELQDFVTKFGEYRERSDDLGGGPYKVRIACKSKGKGKRGGLRIIYYEIVIQEEEKDIALLYIYNKSVIETVSDNFLKHLKTEFLKG